MEIIKKTETGGFLEIKIQRTLIGSIEISFTTKPGGGSQTEYMR